MSHATKSGVATFVAADEKACLEDVRYLLSFLPSNNLEEPPAFESGDDPERLCPELIDLMPATAEPALRHEEGHHDRRRRRRVLRVLPPLGRLDRVRLRPPRTATPSASSATSRWSSPACSTSSPPRRRRGSCARATRSTSRSSRSSTCPASCPASTRSTAASSATAPSCSTPTARRPCRASRSSPARPTAVRTSS